MFIPFLGAYVRYTAREPVADGAGRPRRPDAGRRRVRSSATSPAARTTRRSLVALAYFGFFLNLINLIPVGILDGGAIWRSAKWLRHGGGGARRWWSTGSTSRTAAALAIGMAAAYAPQHRL